MEHILTFMREGYAYVNVLTDQHPKGALYGSYVLLFPAPPQVIYSHSGPSQASNNMGEAPAYTEQYFQQSVQAAKTGAQQPPPITEAYQPMRWNAPHALAQLSELNDLTLRTKHITVVQVKDGWSTGTYLVLLLAFWMVWKAYLEYTADTVRIPQQFVPQHLFDQQVQPPSVWHVGKTARNEHTFYYSDAPPEQKGAATGSEWMDPGCQMMGGAGGTI